MQGDPKVDELMLPVLHAIERHVKDRDAITDIYNRAYEAVMNSMDVKTGKTYCAYCGAEYPLDDAAATLVSEHIKTCEKHPMRAVEAELRKWQTGEIVGIEFVPKMFNELELKNARANARAEKAEARAERLQAALDAANEDAALLADKLSEVVAYGGYYADIENRMPPDGQTFKVIAVSLGGVDDFTVLRMDGKLYFASDPPREVPRGFEIIRIKPWDVKTFGKTEEEDF